MAHTKIHSSPPQPRDSPRARRNDDSPSRQLQFELERAFSQIHLHAVERQKLHAYQRRQQQEDLDAKELAQAEVHRAGLTVAIAQHEVVRRQAEAVLHAYIKQEEEERQRREAEQRRLEAEKRKREEEEQARKQAERERKAREDKERTEREARARAEAERLAIYEKQKAEAEEAQRKEREAAEQKQREEQARADHEAGLKKQEAERLAVAARIPPSVPTTNQPPKSSLASASPSSDLQMRHKEYLTIHKKLKIFRKEFWERVKSDPNLKPHVGDMRRALKTSVGQLTDDKVGNRRAHDRVKTTLQRALQEIPSPPVSVGDYLPPHLSLNDKGTTTIPSLALYLLSMLSKAVINAFVGECVVNSKAAEPVGTLVAQIFSMPELQFARQLHSTNSGSGTASTVPKEQTSVSLISVLMCKFHACAPILFGIYGPETTAAGKLRLGWRLETLSNDKKAFVTEDKHYDRQTGLGVGYASIALRNFSKAKISNPWPPVHFWSSIAHIVNTPPSEVQTSHLILLKSMLENNAMDRFVLFFGAPAIAVLRSATIEFPHSLPVELQEKPVAKALALVVEGWKKEKTFSLS